MHIYTCLLDCKYEKGNSKIWMNFSTESSFLIFQKLHKDKENQSLHKYFMLQYFIFYLVKWERICSKSSLFCQYLDILLSTGVSDFCNQDISVLTVRRHRHYKYS